MRSRRGVSVAVMVLVVFVLAGIGMTLSMQARQAGRTSHWSYHAQLAYNLADAALKQALVMLTAANSAEAARKAPFAATLTDAFERLARGERGGMTLFSSSDGAVPEPLKPLLDELRDFAPKFSVMLRLLESEPLWSGALDGIPAVAGERKGVIQIVVAASVQTPVGIKVDRTLVLEKSYKIVSPLPPLLGRFSLFVQKPPSADVNAVAMKFDPASGNATYEKDEYRPIEVQSPVKAPVVPPASWTLNREAFVSGIQDAKFLDKQGWIYLGGSGDAKWPLHLAHGFSEGGESPLITGGEGRTLFKGQAAEDAAFTQHFKDAFNSLARCISYFPPEDPELGLHLAQHGWASNYEIISLPPERFGDVQDAGGARRRVKFGGGETASLRLFGSAASLSPTLVFGPAMREYLQRATVVAIMGPPLFCFAPGKLRLTVCRLEEHTPSMRGILVSAFGSEAEFQKWGTCVRSEPFVRGLETILRSKGSGEYDFDGLLYLAPFSAATQRSFTSDHLPWLGSLPVTQDMPDATLQKLVRGDLDAPAIYAGNLSGGLVAFTKAMEKKLTYTVTPEGFARRMLVGGKLKVPGVVLVQQESALELGSIKTVEEGGVLITKGSLRIKGNIERGGAEPLTLVSLQGDVEVDPAATTVDAYLVAVNGVVRLKGSATVAGVAGRDIDLSVVKTPGKRVVSYNPDMDPVGARKDLVRVYYGGEEKLAVSGLIDR